MTFKRENSWRDIKDNTEMTKYIEAKPTGPRLSGKFSILNNSGLRYITITRDSCKLTNNSLKVNQNG